MEFHVSRAARDRFLFDQTLFTTDGNVVFANFQAARQFAALINDYRQKRNDNRPITAGQINALGMIDEIFHLVLHKYYEDNGQIIRHALFTELETKIGKQRLDQALSHFVDLFPPSLVYQKKLSQEKYLKGQTNGVSNTERELEELLMLWLTNANPATAPFAELFDENELANKTAYLQIIDGIAIFFKHQPHFGPEHQDLVTMLRMPAIMVPQSLGGQLEYIRTHWGQLLGDKLLKLLGSLDLIKEETRPVFEGPGTTQVPDYANGAIGAFGDHAEIERFSPDSDWMPNVVMMAKNTFVWLNQLSRQYNRQIDRLDLIPDETLDELANWGFTGLWLIGLWERSDASRRIKQMCGNPDAVSSAYSLSRYRIAERLGGEPAYYNLSQRCSQRGIRLASDMVPNHMGIDSDWVYDHPEWFIQREHSPFPAYTFNGADLSNNPQISINLEDHYYSRSDAAVVFKRYDHRTGQTAYLYHGNDGTSMPWNDTAQLNYLNPEVREAVIQTILEVARKFPIIRFDAAMTLTKKHYQRLWFPHPGTGGDIPSRADSAMTKAAFDAAMPEEFWREVVERVAREVPNTLLLAEAFWLMEGYFVRTLGMHRVYNSAFMNMMRNEENDKYRLLIKNTLTYDPQILKRYVNFMNNPDEKTAVEQFGKGDKYFGIAAVMSTMPGLPMFGHGQIEGYSEKYGMEYYRPYWDETPDQDLIRHHQSIIFPLLHQRRVFADVENFTLFDFNNSAGGVDENVFAYSNCKYGHAALVLYHNKFASTEGWIRTSAPFLQKEGSSSVIKQRNLFEALQLQGGPNDFVIYRDKISKNTFIRRLQEIKDRGLYFELGAYSCQVLMDFEIVRGAEFEAIYNELGNRGVYDFESIHHDIQLRPMLNALRQLLNQERLSALTALKTRPSTDHQTEISQDLEQIYQSAQVLYGLPARQQECFDKANLKLAYVINPRSLIQDFGLSAFRSAEAWIKDADKSAASDPYLRLIEVIWALLSDLAGDSSKPKCLSDTLKILSEPAFQNTIQEAIRGFVFNEEESFRLTQLVMALMSSAGWMSTSKPNPLVVANNLLAKSEVSRYWNINEYDQTLWFNFENLDRSLACLQKIGLIEAATTDQMTASELSQQFIDSKSIPKVIREAAKKADYQVAKLIKSLE